MCDSQRTRNYSQHLVNNIDTYGKENERFKFQMKYSGLIFESAVSGYSSIAKDNLQHM